MDAPAPLGAAGFQATAGVSRETLDRLTAYEELLRKWQAKINLIGPATLGDIWRRHFLDSAQLAAHIPPSATRLVDFGPGAGFPGLILAILHPMEVHLIEADSRKVAFLREAARVTGTEVVLHTGRIEAISPFPVDVVTARAVAPLKVLLGYTQPYLDRSDRAAFRCLFLKGREVDRELTEAGKLWKMRATRIPSSAGGEGVILILEDLHRGNQHPT
jgi:16S rRNA (guanine527-N7)-methyltransferase